MFEGSMDLSTIFIWNLYLAGLAVKFPPVSLMVGWFFTDSSPF
jgi:hypothetical protein